MRKLTYIALLISYFNVSIGQEQNIDFDKLDKCRLNIDIHYKDREKDYLEAQKYKDVVIIVIHARKDGKVKSSERGYISTVVKGDYKGTFFESEESRNSIQKSAQFPLFDAKNYYFYDAKCFDELGME